MSSAEIFDTLAQRYDRWYDGPLGQSVFPYEREALARAAEGAPRPWLEVGVGSGRFAEALEIPYGVDPAWNLLKLARARGIQVVQGVAEALPFRDGAFGTVFLIVTLCFLDDLQAALHEIARVLRPDGAVITGLVPADSPWGQFYIQKRAQGHPFYRAATFYTVAELDALALKAGFVRTREVSTLFSPPGQPVLRDRVEETLDPYAGFIALRWHRIAADR